jgi:hypothetical protein
MSVEPVVEVPVEQAEAPPAAGGGWRTVLAAIAGVLAVICLTLALVGVWANVTVFNSGRVADIVTDALDDPEVDTALATWVTNEVFSAVDLDAVVTNILPPRLDRFAPTLVSGAQTFVTDRLTTALSNPDVQDLLHRAVERAHSALMRLLSGDGLIDGITVQDGAVTVNLLPLISRGLTFVQGLGLLDQLDVPELTRDGEPREQIAQLEAATGRDLPENFGQLTVYQSDKLAEAQASVQSAQRAFALVRRSTVLLVILAVVFIVATILLAHRRWHATLWLALGSLVAMMLSRLLVNRIVDEAPDLVTRPGARAAVANILDDATRGLLRLTALIGLLAILAVLVTLFRRNWRSSDLVLVGAVIAGLAVVAILGFSLVSLLIGIAIGVAVVVLVPRLLASKRQVTTAT